MKMVKLGDALPRACIDKLSAFHTRWVDNALDRSSGKALHTLLREQVLEPFRVELEKDWDLDYLSMALCHVLGME